MAKLQVVQAVEARLAEKWATLPAAPPVYGINLEGTTPGDGTTFIELQFPASTTKTWDLKGTRYREEGAFRLIVQAARGAGLTDGLQLIEDLTAIFRGKKFGGVQTFAPSSAVLDDRNDNGLYYPISFSVPYQFDFTDETGFD